MNKFISFDEALKALKSGGFIKYGDYDRIYCILPHMKSGRPSLNYSDDNGKTFCLVDSFPERQIMSNKWQIIKD